jgi:hypothetical protein
LRTRDNPSVSDRAAGPSERSWWQTLPGMLTAAAALISAITGLIVALHQLLPSGHSTPQPSAATATQTTSEQAAGATGAGETAAGTKTPPANRTSARVSFPSGRTARVGEARYDVAGAGASAGNPGELVLAVRVRMTNQSRYDGNFWNRSFRLAAGGETSAPTNFVNDLVPGGTTKTETFDFTVPASTRRATLLVGDDPAKAVSLPLVLAPRR